MKRAVPFIDSKLEEWNNIKAKYKNHPLFEDAGKENIGILNNKIVIIDYGGFV